MFLGFMSLLNVVGDTARDVSEMLNYGYGANDVFGDVRNAVRETGNQGFQLMLTVTIAGCTCALVYAAIKLANGDPRKREEAKADIGRVLLCTVGIFSIAWIVYLVGVTAAGTIE